MTASTIRLDGAELVVRTYPAGDTYPGSGELMVYAGVGTVFSVSGITPAQLHELADAFACAAREVSTPIREAAEEAAMSVTEATARRVAAATANFVAVEADLSRCSPDEDSRTVIALTEQWVAVAEEINVLRSKARYEVLTHAARVDDLSEAGAS